MFLMFSYYHSKNEKIQVQALRCNSYKITFFCFAYFFSFLFRLLFLPYWKEGNSWSTRRRKRKRERVGDRGGNYFVYMYIYARVSKTSSHSIKKGYIEKIIIKRKRKINRHHMMCGYFVFLFFVVFCLLFFYDLLFRSQEEFLWKTRDDISQSL